MEDLCSANRAILTDLRAFQSLPASTVTRPTTSASDNTLRFDLQAVLDAEAQARQEVATVWNWQRLI
ncbi:hypothetical protein DTO271D3_5875 [Paecilomyces variotii]|nr:hypothetical protein DTO169C6_4151 [Paecilomyces variotii]KAJ9246093.1 hypothetical protein DTO169E5_217 [Paecilomyces variotii]KAJ9259094.1 hypothetical protein DTO207G8_1254 [Paecilomyces variotii]KAJ9304287.1 hypothetical protein DTO217A2_6251 [Paecilomyces variotii]KAJ9313781.1 hypothetical protein DTO271D3_5875 [Paecilomyces variotii]